MSFTGDRFKDFGNKQIHILRGEQEILQLEGEIVSYSYSPDGKLLIMETARLPAGYIIDLEKAEILRKLNVRCASNSSIANKGCPYLAYWFHDKIKVINYITGELVLEEEIVPDIGVEGNNFRKIQISGNGKEIMVFRNNLYKKYEIMSSEGVKIKFTDILNRKFVIIITFGLLIILISFILYQYSRKKKRG